MIYIYDYLNYLLLAFVTCSVCSFICRFNILLFQFLLFRALFSLCTTAANDEQFANESSANSSNNSWLLDGLRLKLGIRRLPLSALCSRGYALSLVARSATSRHILFLFLCTNWGHSLQRYCWRRRRLRREQLTIDVAPLALHFWWGRFFIPCFFFLSCKQFLEHLRDADFR